MVSVMDGVRCSVGCIKVLGVTERLTGVKGYQDGWGEVPCWV